MSFQIQQKIKHNALEMRQYMTDLYDWQQEMQLKQKTKAQIQKQERSKIKQTEVKITINQPELPKQKPIQKKVDLVRDVNTVSEYYKAWDKFDVDQQLTKLEEEEKRAYRPYNPYEESKNNLRAKPKTRVNIQGRRNVVSDPSELKDKGNLHFQSLQFQKAINCYTQCLTRLDQEGLSMEQQTQAQKKLRCVVLSNRSMAYLKIQETVKALQDASLSLAYDDKYSKSYYRRAECLKKLGKYKQSLRDFKTVRTLEPGETKADAQIRKIQAFLAKRCKQARQALITQYSPNLLIGSNSKRIQIKELQQLQSRSQANAKPVKANYLQEL